MIKKKLETHMAHFAVNDPKSYAITHPDHPFGPNYVIGNVRMSNRVTPQAWGWEFAGSSTTHFFPYKYMYLAIGALLDADCELRDW